MKRFTLALTLAFVMFAATITNSYAASPVTYIFRPAQTTQTVERVTVASVVNMRNGTYILIGQTEALQTVMVYTQCQKCYKAWALHTNDTVTLTMAVTDWNAYSTYYEGTLVSWVWSSNQ